MTRIGINYRNQWLGLDQNFNLAYIDHYLFDYNSGIRLIFNGSQESMANLSTDAIGLSYAYRLKLGEDLYFRVGGMASFIQRYAFFNDVDFGTQIDIKMGRLEDH
jgi:hypothetical protein